MKDCLEWPAVIALLPSRHCWSVHRVCRAPSVDILGSFFPVWMVCSPLAYFSTFGLRILLLRTRMEAEVGPLALFYPCAVILFTGLLWLIFFR